MPHSKTTLSKDVFNAADRQLLAASNDDELDLANILIENAVGYFKLPLALAPGIVVNHKEYPIIPMVTEETSVVAGLRSSILFARKHGTISASQQGSGFIGQIHFPELKNPDLFERNILKAKSELISQANQNPCASMAKRGGGVCDLSVRCVARPDGKILGVVHIVVDTCDAMGANLINQTCEYLKPLLETLTTETALVAILSNLNTEKLTKIEITFEDVDVDLANRIATASMLAQCDPYRAVTHNKGIMNGMTAVCIATGNDSRALEAGMHGFAADKGCYVGLSQWQANGNQLIGNLVAPINIGIVGGMTSIHPMAAFALRCLVVNTATELAFVMGTVGLLQNFAALRALVTDGITKGHMSLHLKNLLRQTNANASEQKAALVILKKILAEKHFITASDAQSVLQSLRL